VLLVLAGCPTGGGQHPVGDVAIKGNHAYGDGDIVARLATRPPQGWLIRTREELDPVALDLDRERVEAFYHERGYFDAHVTDVSVQKSRDGVARVQITVEEGDPTKIAAVDVVGVDMDLARRAFARGEFSIEPGTTFQHPDYLLAKDALQRAVIKKGYAHAEVKGDVEVVRAERRARIRLDVDPGPLVHFGKVKVEGLKTVPESAVLNRVAWKEGELFDPERLTQTEGRLFLLGVFSAVHADFEHEGRPPIVDITIRVAESTKHEVRLGFGVAIDQARIEVRTRATYSIRDIAGPLTQFRADVTPGYSWQRAPPQLSSPSITARGELTKDDFLIANLRGSAFASFDREPHPGYILTGPRFGVSVAYPFNDDLTLRVGWQLRYLVYDEYDPTVFSGDALESRLGYYQQQLVYDRRDRPLDAHEGYYLALEALEGGWIAAGQVGFVRLKPEVRGYVPLGRRIVLAARAYYGRIVTNGIEDTPLPIRFYGGGADDHRGFGYERLSPQRRDSGGNLIPIGGSEEALGSVEARVEMFQLWQRWVSAAAFLDSGDVTDSGELDLGNLHHAVGLGLRYDTLIGPVRVDVGYRLNRLNGPNDPDPDSRYAFHLSLGEAF
jgi:translocation and assembly module TamA